MAKRKYRKHVDETPSPLAVLTAELASIRELLAKQSAPNPAGTHHVQTGPRTAYAIVPTPLPTGGDTVQTVYAALKSAKGGKLGQKDLESTTGLSEGQIKGAIRQLVTSGFVTTTKA